MVSNVKTYSRIRDAKKCNCWVWLLVTVSAEYIEVEILASGCITTQVLIIDLYIRYMLACLYLMVQRCQHSQLHVYDMSTEEAFFTRLALSPWILSQNVESVSFLPHLVLSFTQIPTPHSTCSIIIHLASLAPSEIQFGSNTSADSHSIYHFLMTSLSSALNVL